MISAELWELMSFFEVEPTFPHPEDPWPYTDAVFNAIANGSAVEFSIAPSYGDVTLTIQHEDKFDYEFTALSLLDVRYSNEDDGETLELRLSQKHSIILSLKPIISIRHQRTGLRETQFDN